MECDGNSQRVRAKKEQVTNTEGVDVKCVIGIDGKDDAFVLSVLVVLVVVLLVLLLVVLVLLLVLLLLLLVLLLLLLLLLAVVWV